MENIMNFLVRREGQFVNLCTFDINNFERAKSFLFEFVILLCPDIFVIEIDLLTNLIVAWLCFIIFIFSLIMLSLLQGVLKHRRKLAEVFCII